MVYYNEFDAKKAAWLRELMRRDVIAPGDIDERSILDVRPDDLAGYTQCHFFAGIGVWSYALRRAGLGDAEEVWTGSCPCQPFSPAGKGLSFEDERHLFPAWSRLIEARRPKRIFGEQVSNGDGLAWLDVVRSSMDSAGYTLGVVDLCSAGFGSPNIRQRLYFVAESSEDGCSVCGTPHHDYRDHAPRHDTTGCRAVGVMADAERRPAERHGQQMGAAASSVQRQAQAHERERLRTDSRHGGDVGILADADEAGPQGRSIGGHCARERTTRESGVAGGMGDAGPVNGFWGDAEWIWCRDERWRPTEPGTFPLVTGAPARVLRLRGYGDAINAEVATEFIKACCYVRNGGD